ncbi:MAG: DNA repair protein RecN, partial [Legionellales bacterium RIFCSPHIGHO2_12_FULL_35_11]
MLTSLRIENFTIVKFLELDFQTGMNAFTGETGAGKSIMLDALVLVLGGQSDVALIRHDEEKCDITATFYIDHGSEPINWLINHDAYADDNLLIIRRILQRAGGRSKSLVNGHQFSIQKIKELSSMLVHIYGQHEHHLLWHHATSRQQLDAFALNSAILDKLSQCYKIYQALKQERDAIAEGIQNNQFTTDLIYKIDELSELNTYVGEMDSLSKEHQLLHHSQDYLQYSQQISQLLGSEESSNIYSQLHLTLNLMQYLPPENQFIRNAIELLSTGIIQCQEALTEVLRFVEQVSVEPERLAEIEKRLSAVHNMARKYHIDPDSLPKYLDDLQDTLRKIEINTLKLELLETSCQTALNDYHQIAAELSASRKQASKKLSQKITSIIQQLAMPHGKIEILINKIDKIQPYGLDKVEYLVCTNPGMPLDSLQKIASGGELSRISLAIQMVTAQQSSTPTLLFDEVDVGIGGATASLVGELLRNLGDRLQIFCVTHQPQVA